MKFVYIIEANGLFKIGYSNNPIGRVATARIFSPLCELLAVYNGTVKDERALHAMFSRCHKSGEWFRLTESDLSLIEAYFAGKESLNAYKTLLRFIANERTPTKRIKNRPYRVSKEPRDGVSHLVTVHDRRELARQSPPILNNELIALAKQVYAEGGKMTDISQKCGISASYAQKIYAALNRAGRISADGAF
jgi:hypothetical protein